MGKLISGEGTTSATPEERLPISGTPLWAKWLMIQQTGTAALGVLKIKENKNTGIGIRVHEGTISIERKPLFITGPLNLGDLYTYHQTASVHYNYLYMEADN